MKRLISIITAGILASLTFSSCELSHNEFDEVIADVYLTVYYSGGYPAETVQGSYDLSYPYLRTSDVTDIFYDLSRFVTPGFWEARMEVEYYDWMDNYLDTEIYDFWWETYDHFTGDGAYVWEQVR